MANRSIRILMSAAIATAGLMTLPMGTQARALNAYSGQDVALGGYRGTVYYAPKGAEFVVVVTMDNAGQPMRFVTSLKPGQRAKISTPGALGRPDASVVFRRDGDHLFVDERPSQARPAARISVRQATKGY